MYEQLICRTNLDRDLVQGGNRDQSCQVDGEAQAGRIQAEDNITEVEKARVEEARVEQAHAEEAQEEEP